MKRIALVATLAACGTGNPAPAPPAPQRTEHRVEVKRRGAGAVRSEPAGIDCGKVCEAHFPEETEVKLTAESTPTSAFFGWAGAGCRAGATSCSFTIGEPTVVQAFFPGVRETRWQVRVGGERADFARDVAVDVTGRTWLLSQTDADDHATLMVQGFDALGAPSPAWKVVDTERDATVGAALAAGTDVLYVAGGAVPNGRPFLSALTPDGALRWDARLPEKLGQPFAVATTPDGGVVVGGAAFLGSYSATGKKRWLREARGLEIRAIATSGKLVAVAGTVRSRATLGGARLSPNGASDAFVAVLDARGNVQWARRYGGDGPDEARALAFVDDDLAVGGAQDDGVPFVALLDGRGEQRWWKRWEALPRTGYVADLVYAADGRIHTTGLFGRAVTLGKIDLAAAQSDAFLVSYNANGTIASGQRIGSANGPTPGRVAPLGAGGVVVAATFDGRFDLAGRVQSSEGLTDVILARLAP
jgi:hypothetical protein